MGFVREGDNQSDFSWGLFLKEDENMPQWQLFDEIKQEAKWEAYMKGHLPAKVPILKPIIVLAFQDSGRLKRNFAKEFYEMEMALRPISVYSKCEFLFLPDTSTAEIRQIFEDPQNEGRIRALYFSATESDTEELLNFVLENKNFFQEKELNLLYINSEFEETNIEELVQEISINTVFLSDRDIQKTIVSTFPSRFFYSLAAGMTPEEAFKNAKVFTKIIVQSTEDVAYYRTQVVNTEKYESWHLEEDIAKLSLRPYNIPQEIKAKGSKSIEKYIDSIPEEIVKSGPEAIKTYLASIQDKKNTTYNYEGKLIFVGQGGVGKTTLSKKLISPYLNRKEDEEITKGLDTRNWYPTIEILNEDGNKQEVPFKFNIWDFGGQEKYRSIQELFLTDNSIYLLVTAARGNSEISDISWLHALATRTKNSPIIHVLNKIDDLDKSINEKNIQERFPNIKFFRKVSCDTNAGLEQLIENIKQIIPSLFSQNSTNTNEVNRTLGHELANSWIDVKKELESRLLAGTNHLSIDEYFEICEDNNVPENEGRILLAYLHNCGTLLYFDKPTSLENLVILNPDWLKNAVYEIIASELILKKAGKLSRKDLNGIWKKYKLKVSERNQLQMLLEKVGTCFKLEGSDENEAIFIFPEFLQEAFPASFQSEISGLRDSSEKVIREIHFDPLVPKSLLSRLMIDFSNFIPVDGYSKKGFFVNYEKLETKAIIEEQTIFPNQKIVLHISGDQKLKLYEKIIEQVDEIYGDLYQKSNVKYEVKIPCSCTRCVSDEFKEKDRHFFSKPLIQKYKQHGLTAIVCEKSIEEVGIAHLLTGDFASKRRPTSNNNDGDKNVFISYSHKDTEWLEKVNTHLKPIVRNSTINLWDDHKIQAGDNWAEEIENAMTSADIALLLVSADFMASDFINEVELPTLLDKAVTSGTRILPLIISSSWWNEDENFSKFQTINDPQNEALIDLDPGALEAILLGLAKMIAE